MSSSTSDISFMIEQVRSLSGSYGISPFAVLEIDPDVHTRELIERVTSANLANYHKGVVILEWIDYSQNDLINHLKFSKEISDLTADERSIFVKARLSELSYPIAFNNWKDGQANLAVGILLASARQINRKAYLVPDIFIGELEHCIRKLPNLRVLQLVLLS